MSAAGQGKSVDSRLLVAVFFVIGAAICFVSVKIFEARLAAANEAREAAYAAEYAAFDEAYPVEETTDGAAADDAQAGDAPAIMDEAAPAE